MHMTDLQMTSNMRSSRKSGYTQGQGHCSEKTPSQKDEYTKASGSSARTNAK